MTVTRKSILMHKQEELMKERDAWECMQTDYSTDNEFYKYCEWKMNRLNEEAEELRLLLERGCSDE